MSALKDLINQIENPELRTRVQQEVERLLGQKKFGLVFENHLPESLQLPEVPIRRGSRVALRAGSPSDAMIVKSIEGDIVKCLHLSTNVEIVVSINDLVCVAQFGDPIYPYLQVVDKVQNTPDSEVWHALIEADNYHALQLLAYLFPGKVSCIYIDPPYNTGARDWKYNNNYVDSNDQYRHSKWLSMMKRRLELAKLLLDPKESVLVVTIDEKECVHLGCLLEETFPNARIQMVSIVHNPGGAINVEALNRVNEYAYYLFFGNAKPNKSSIVFLNNEDKKQKQSSIRRSPIWRGLLRGGSGPLRTDSPLKFYPILVDKNGKVVGAGNPLSIEEDRNNYVGPEGLTVCWPLKTGGIEGRWELKRSTFIERLEMGYVKAGNLRNDGSRTIYYLRNAEIERIQNGELVSHGCSDLGYLEIEYNDEVDRFTFPKTVWSNPMHNATEYGTKLIKSILGRNKFTFPKSLYAVKDAISFIVTDKPNAIIVDFFAGSGTTLHAVNLLNAEDGGHRHCIMVTNNEVSEDEAKSLSEQGYRPGDKEWEKLGIAHYVTWPRTRCSILGIDINGRPLGGDYILTGSQENEVTRSVKLIAIDTQGLFADKKFKKQIVSLFGGKIPQSAVTDDTRYLVEDDWEYAVLFDTTATDDFIDELAENQSAKQIFIFTCENRVFNSIKNRIADEVPPLTKKEIRTRAMSEGFAANAIYFKLGFLDKNAVALGRQFRELLPLLWMKTGARGDCPQLNGDAVPDVMTLPANHFAILNEESAFMQLEQQLKESQGIDTVFIVTDSEPAFRRMQNQLPQVQCIQLYRDYLDNFRINVTK